MDRSNGYERVAVEFLAGRGSARSAGIGAKTVRDWARTLQRGDAVIDLGCGSGLPITEVLVGEGLNVYAIDAAPSFVQAFRRNLPNIPVACEAVEDSPFFDRTFDGVVAWGLMFLLSPEEQRRLIQRIADIVMPGGRVLFTSCAQPLVWNDAMTGLESRSLGAVEYRRQLSAVGLWVHREYEDEGQNHYFDAFKKGKCYEPTLRFPSAVKRDLAIEAWMRGHADDWGAIAQRWFEVMRTCGDDVRELLHDGHPTACVDDAAFGYVNAFKAHVNVGFFRGAELSDPSGLQEGTGKFMRHVKLRPESEIDATALMRLIETAYTDMKGRLKAESCVEAA